MWLLVITWYIRVPHVLPNALRHRIIEPEEISGKSQTFKELLPISHSSCQNEDFSVLLNISRKTKIEIF